MDKERIIRLIEEAKESLKIMEEIVSLSFEEFISDIRNRYTLRMAIVELVESLVVASARMIRETLMEGERVEGYVETVKKLMERRILAQNDVETLEKLIRLRNIIIHRYWEVDDRRIYNEAKGSGIEAVRRIVDRLMEYVQRF